jgi:hypothetical protein
MKNSYLILKNKHRSESANILGAGSSFFYLLKDERYLNIYEDVVIGVNSSIIAFPKNENIVRDKIYWLSNDALCRRWSWWETVKKYNCRKIVRDSWLKYNNELKDFLYFSPRPTSEDIINSNDDGLVYCSSVPSSIDLSIQMGCKKIFLFGVDHCRGENGAIHFWDLFLFNNRPIAIPSAQSGYIEQKKVFDFSVQTYKALNIFAKESNVKIYNVNLKSELNVFEKISLNDYWRMKNDKN